MNAFLITVFVLVPFGWFIYAMIRYTAKSLGDESPLAIKVTYEVTEQEYFTRFDFLFLIFLTLSSILMLYCTVFFAIPSIQTIWHGFASVLFVAVSLFSLWHMAMLFTLEWQYWLITKEKITTLDPADKSLEIATAEEIVHFTAADVQEIEKHMPGPSSGKLVAGYMYFIFRLKNGQAVYLNYNKSYLHFALDEYFKGVPIRRVWHKIPWIIAP